MATHATNPDPVSILKPVAPRISPSADPAIGRSWRSSLGLASLGKATSVLGAPVVGLVALVAISAAGTSVGAGLGSLPGTHGLSGAGGHGAVQASRVGRLAGSPLAIGRGVPARSPAARSQPATQGVLGSVAGSLTNTALAGVGVGPRHGNATTGGDTSGGAALPSGHGTPNSGGGANQPSSSVGTGGPVVTRSGNPSQSGQSPSGSGTGGSGSEPSGGSQLPPDNPGQSGHGMSGPAQGGQGGSSSPPSSSSSSSGGGSSALSGSSQTSSGQSPTSTSSSQPSTSGGSSSQPATTSSNSPQASSSPPPATNNGDYRDDA